VATPASYFCSRVDASWGPPRARHVRTPNGLVRL
jgi:hypothetical protein